MVGTLLAGAALGLGFSADTDAAPVLEQKFYAFPFERNLQVAERAVVGEAVACFKMADRALRDACQIGKILLRKTQPTPRSAYLLPVNHNYASKLQLCAF
jgi:hypothetical protein